MSYDGASKRVRRPSTKGSQFRIQNRLSGALIEHKAYYNRTTTSGSKAIGGRGWFESTAAHARR